MTQGVNAAVRQAAGAKERGDVVRFGQFLRAWRALFGQVFSRARALNKARAEGRLGEDYEAFLDDLMGTDSASHGDSNAANDNAERTESITDISDGKTTPLTLNPGETLWEENGVTFGVAPVPFADNVEAAVKGRLPANAILDMGRPGEVLQKAGVPDLPMWIRLSKVRKKRGKHSELTAEVLKKFPEAMDSPMLVYVSPGDRKAHSIVTSIATSQGPLTAYFTVHEREGQNVLEAKTLFGKEPGELLAEIREAETLGLITHKNRGAFEAWLAQSDGALDGTSTQHGPAIEGLKEVFHDSSDSQAEADSNTDNTQSDTTYGMLPTQRQDKPGSWEEVKPGHTWASAKKFLPKLKDKRPPFAIKRGAWEVLVQRLAKWLGQMQKVSDPWGAQVALANPQKRGNFADPLENRAAHLIGRDPNKTEDRSLHYDKLAWIGAVTKTISDAQVRVTNGAETFYFRSYAEGVHMVVVEDAAIKDQYALVTQYAPELSNSRFEGALVEQVRPVAGLAPQGGPGAVGIPAQPQSQAVQTPQPRAQKDTTTGDAESQSMSLLPDVPNPSMGPHLDATSTGPTSADELHNRIGKLRSVRSARISGEMDAAPFRGTGNYGGILLTEGMLKAIEKRIAELTPHGEEKWTLVRNSDTYLRGFTARAGFNPTTCQMHLRSDATYFDYFHELCHATMRAQLGSVEEYYKIREYDREMYVFDQIAKNEYRFTEEEINRAIEDALHYYNKCGPRTHQYKIGK